MISDSINRDHLLKAANLVKAAVSGQSYIPSLTHILFDGVMATAYNDVTSISVRSPFSIECCLPSDLLIKTLNSLPGDQILVSENDGVILFASGRSKIKIPFLNAIDFPTPLPKDKIGEIKITDELLRGVDKCLMSVGTDPTHPSQMGVTLEDGGILFSTDNYTISRYETNAKVKLPGGIPLILPTFFCMQLVSLGKAFQDEEIILTLYSGAIVASFGDQASLFTKLVMDLEPMDFDRIMNKFMKRSDLEAAAIPIPATFDAAFQRALLVLQSSVDKITKLELDKGVLTLESTSSNGESVDTLPFDDPDGPDAPFYIDPTLVVRASKSCSKVALLTKVMVLTNDSFTFTHLIAHCSA